MSRSPAILAAVLLIAMAGAALWWWHARASAGVDGDASAAPEPADGAGLAVSAPDAEDSAFAAAELSEQEVASLQRDVDAEAGLQSQALAVKAGTPVPRWQRERVERIAQEDLPTLLSHLADFDDNQFAMTISADGFYYGDPEDEMLRVAHLLRVRRLLAEGRQAPEVVAPLLRDALAEALAQWPTARAERVRLWETHPQGFTEDEPGAYQRVSVQAMAATYLLAELGRHESLPLLRDSYDRQLRWLREYKPFPALPVPVPPAMSLYAMHRLVQGYPRERLGPEAAAAADAYARWAEGRVPPPARRRLTPWDASHDSADPIVAMRDPTCLLVRSRPDALDVSIYPATFADGSPMQGATDSAPTPEADAWLGELDKVIAHLPR